MKINNKINEDDIINYSKTLIIDAIKKTTRSDVPIAFTLSGGIDSSVLTSVASKILNLKFKTYSVIDDDRRYDERENINKIVNNLKCHNRQVKVKYENSLDDLRNIISLMKNH